MRQFTIASFGGAGQTSIQATAADAFGNIYVAGTTSAPDFPVKNAAQPKFGDARILRSTSVFDNFSSWQPVGSPPADVTAVASDPALLSVLYAAGPSGIYKSTDTGATWRLVYAFQGNGQFNSTDLALGPGNPPQLAAIVPGTGALIRSLDGGETWSATGNTGSTLTALGGALISGSSISRDWGLTFQRLTPPGAGSISTVAFDPWHPGWIYVDVAAGTQGSLWLSTDLGTTWTAKASPNDTFSAFYSLAVDPTNPNVILGLTPDGLFMSTDGAASWSGPRRGLNFDEFKPLVFLPPGCLPGGAVFALAGAGSTASVAFSPDYGNTWTTPRLSGVTSITPGWGCPMLVTREISTDAFVAKLAADGTVVWATYLGGVDRDQAVALAVDSQGNVIVTGNTLSPDFPGPAEELLWGQQAVFVTKYSASGSILYSKLIGGSGNNSAAAAAALSDGGVYVAGNTNSTDFPVTPGTLQTQMTSGSYTGFLERLSANGRPEWATFLGPSYARAGAVLADAAGNAIVAGTGTVPGAAPPVTTGTPVFVVRLNGTGSQVVASAYIPGATQWNAVPNLPMPPSGIALAVDAAGNVFVFGGTGSDATVTAGAYNAPQPAAACMNYYGPEGNAFVARLGAQTLTPAYVAMLRAPCGIAPGEIAVDGAGAAVVGMAASPGMQLRGPLLAAGATAIAKLSPDGSSLEFATYLDNYGTPGIAVGADGSFYAGVTSATYFNNGPAGVLHLAATQPGAISVDGIANAFSGDASGAVSGGLYTLTGTGFQPPTIDLGLDAASLPTTLGGLQVTFDDVPAPIVRTSVGTVTVEMPPVLKRRNGKLPGFTLMQLTWNGSASEAVWVPVEASAPGLMTRNYPAVEKPAAGGFDAYARNADGTLNDAGHPAAVGSKVTVFVTGMGATQTFTTWDQLALGPPSGAQPPGEAVTTAPGMISAVQQIVETVPSPLQNYGTPDANGVRRVPLALQSGPHYSSNPPPISNVVWLYIK